MARLSRRELAVGSAFAAFGSSACAKPAGGAGGLAPPRSSRHLVDPALLEGLKRGFQGDIAHPPTLAELNARTPDVAITQREIPGAPGSPPVSILVIAPKSGRPGRPGLLNIHGGGYIAGAALQQSAGTVALVQALGCTAISVDYRLAPQTPFPGALDDNYAALKWFYDNAASLDVDRSRIAIIGGSAGGGHAAMLALRARDRGEVPILMQCLQAPMLDDRTGTTLDPGPYTGEFVWTREANQRGWRALLGVEPGSATVPAGSSPGRVENLAGLPPTFITVGALDLFAQESLAFASRLMRAGVPTELHVWDGVMHGAGGLAPEAPVIKRDQMVLEASLRAAFERGPRTAPA